jgi:glycosyltransferase involved in cell wall biosynthesis
VSSVAGYDLVVIHREAFPFFTPAMEKMVFARNRRVVYSFDDAVYAGHQDTSTLNHRLLYRIKYGPGINEVLRRSMHVIAGSEVLAAHARQFNSRVSVIPTVIDLHRYIPAFESVNGDRPLTVGWYGSNSTAPYVAALEPALRRLAQANPGRVRFRFYGDPSLKLDLPDFKSLPFQLESEIEDLRQIEIGLMPMPDTLWTRGKCAFKAIQYMAIGAASIVSPVGMATGLVRDGVNGFHAGDTERWYNCMQQLLDDSALRRRFRLEARRTIEREFCLQVWGPRFVRLLEDVIEGRGTAVGAGTD